MVAASCLIDEIPRRRSRLLSGYVRLLYLLLEGYEVRKDAGNWDEALYCKTLSKMLGKIVGISNSLANVNRFANALIRIVTTSPNK
jgi:hypothetical protein